VSGISWGGHVGGLIGGGLAALAIEQSSRLRRGIAPAIAVCAVIGAVAAIAAAVFAGNSPTG
jgi:hypothetical protein